MQNRTMALAGFLGLTAGNLLLAAGNYMLYGLGVVAVLELLTATGAALLFVVGLRDEAAYDFDDPDLPGWMTPALAPGIAFCGAATVLAGLLVVGLSLAG
ncbi:MAG: hypothetical protein ABEJ08_02400 [Halobacteriaceae archaeon]